nr:DUF4160 domain-containing protein [Fluviibacter phosphoraccumulans]
MPTVLRINGFRVVIYPNDHRPAHVHVLGSDGEAIFKLHCPKGAVELRENFGLSRQEIDVVIKALQAEVVYLCGAWRRIHETE